MLMFKTQNSVVEIATDLFFFLSFIEFAHYTYVQIEILHVVG